MNTALPDVEKIPRRVAFAVFAGAFLASLVAVSVTALPLYRDFLRQAELDIAEELGRRAVKAAEILSETIRTASQFGCMDETQVGEYPADPWWSPIPTPPAAIPEVAQVDFSRIAGIVHYDSHGQITADAGLGALASRGGIRRFDRNASVALQDLFYVNDQCHVSVLVPCSGKGGCWGGELVICRVPDLDALLDPSPKIGVSARLWLVDSEPCGTLRFLAPRVDAAGDSPAARPNATLRQAVRVSFRSPVSRWAFIEYPEGRMAVTYQAVTGTPWGMVLTVDSREMYIPAYRRLALLGGGMLAIMITVSVLAYLTVRPLVGRLDGTVEGMIGERARRMQEYQRAGREQNHGRRLFGEFVDQVPLGIIRTAANGRALAANPAAARIFGAATPRQLLEHINSRGWEKTVSGDRSCHPASVWDSPEGARSVPAVKGVCHRLDGTPFEAEISLMYVPPTHDSSGEIYVSLRDLAFQRDAEERLERQDRFERFIARLAAELMEPADMSAEDPVQSALYRFARLSGACIACFRELDPKEGHPAFQSSAQLDGLRNGGEWHGCPAAVQWLSGKVASGEDVVVNDVKTELAEDGTGVRASLLAGGIRSLVWTVVAAAADRRWAVGLASSLPGAGLSYGIVGRMRLLGELLGLAVVHRRSQWESRQLRLQVAHASRINTAGLLVGSALPDVLGALAEDRKCLELALAAMVREGENAREGRPAIEKALAANEHARRSLDQLCSLVSREASSPAPLCLSDLMEDALALIRPRLQSCGIACELKIGKGLPRVVGRGVELRHLLQILLQNACNTLCDSGKRPGKIKFSAESEVKPGMISLAVEDNGSGVPAETVSRLFDPFFTLRPESQGIGLSIARQIVEDHGGTIRAVKNPAGGMTFSVLLPTAEVRGKRAPAS